MDLVFEASFARDLKRIRDKTILQLVQDVIEEVRSASAINDVCNLKKMRGYETFYRIRLRNYRLGIEVIGQKVIFVRILHRKDIYRYFP